MLYREGSLNIIPMSTTPPLTNINPDILREILALLDGRDLITLSQTSRQMAALVSEAHWQKIFERDFSFQGLAARKVILKRHPGTCWRDCYVSCFYKVPVIWGSLRWLSPDRPSSMEIRTENLGSYSLDTYLKLRLPATLIARDILCSEGVFVLGIDGRVSSFKLKNENSESPTLVKDSRIDSQPGPFTEISMTHSQFFALDLSGYWWSWNCSEGVWIKTFEGEKIWPGTFHAIDHLQAIALSDCGRYIYLGEAFYGSYVIELPELLRGLPLERFDTFIVQSCCSPMETRAYYLVCLQVDGLCHVVILDNNRAGRAEHMLLFTNSLIVQITLWKDGYEFNDRTGHMWYEFEFTCASGMVIHGYDNISFTRAPRLTFSRQPNKVGMDREASIFRGPNFHYELSKTGEIYGEGNIYCGTPRIIFNEGWPNTNIFISRGYTEKRVPDYLMPRSNQGPKVNLPPLTNFRLNAFNASALALPPNESFLASIESDISRHLEVIKVSEH